MHIKKNTFVMINYDALFKISYGLYIVSSGDGNDGNGFISNSVFQVTSSPIQIAACCNKDNFTASVIEKKGAFSVSVLGIDASKETIGKFGYTSGKESNKLEYSEVKIGSTGVPIVLDDAIATLECKLVNIFDVGTHLLFIGEVIESELITDEQALTYEHYRNVKKGLAPKNAPTYVDKEKTKTMKEDNSNEIYRCSACGYEHSIAEGDTGQNVAPGTPWDEIPETFQCPLCGVYKEDFDKVEN